MQFIRAHPGSHFSQLDQQTCSSFSLCLPRRTQIAKLRVWRPVRFVCVAAVGNPGELFGRRTLPYSPSHRATSAKHRNSLAPLELESSEGQALMERLQNHENLSPAASQQLELLAAEWPMALTDDGERKSGNENYVLYRRIALIKEKERSRVVEEIMYALVVEKFADANLSMAVPMASIPECERNTDFALEDHRKLEALMPAEARELIQDHVATVIGGRNATGCSFDPDTFTRISKLRMGRIYAATVMYGYFLRRIHRRFKLDERLSWMDEPRGQEMKAYLRSMDKETQQRHGRMKVGASVQVIERHVEALFGKPSVILNQKAGVGSSPPSRACNCDLYLKLGSVKSLVLEALAFGIALWETEALVLFSNPVFGHWD